MAFSHWHFSLLSAKVTFGSFEIPKFPKATVPQGMVCVHKTLPVCFWRVLCRYGRKNKIVFVLEGNVCHKGKR